MKSIAASIIVLAGAYLIAAGVQWIDSPKFLVALLGLVLVGIGLFEFFRSIADKSD